MAIKLLTSNSSTQLNENDLAFIKLNFRYPLNSFRKLFPLIFYVVFIGVIAAAFFLLRSEGYFSFSKILPRLFPLLISSFVMTIGVYRYWQSLFFEIVTTGFSETANRTLLTDFFSINQLRYYEMPENPEVFFINSCMNETGKEQEIVVFVVVQKTILVNSHISTSNIFPRGKRKYKELVKLLENFIDKSNPVLDLTRN